MALEVLIGQTDYSKLVFIPDPASTDGSGKTGLVAADLTVSYARVETDNDVTITDATGSLNDLANITAAHNDWGLKEVSSSLAPGLYRLDIADAVFAAGAWTAVVYVMITSSAAVASPMEFALVAFNNQDGIRLGLTALPNAAADAAGGLPISDAGGLDLDAQKADVTTIKGRTIVVFGTAAGAGPGSDTLELEDADVTTNDQYNGAAGNFIIAIVGGTGRGQQRPIIDTVAASNSVQVAGGDWETPVDSTSVYIIFGN